MMVEFRAGKSALAAAGQLTPSQEQFARQWEVQNLAKRMKEMIPLSLTYKRQNSKPPSVNLKVTLLKGELMGTLGPYLGKLYVSLDFLGRFHACSKSPLQLPLLYN